MVSYAEYSGRLENDVARFDGRLVVHHAGDEWTRVPLPLGDVTLEKVEIDGRPAAVADRRPAVYLQATGLHVIDVRFSVPVDRLGATGQLTVPLHSVAAGRFLFALPAADLEVQVSGAPGGWRRLANIDDSAGNKKETAPTPRVANAAPLGRTVCVPLGTGGALSVRWQPRRTTARAGALVSVAQTLLAEVRDAGLFVRGTLHYQVQQGTLGEMTLRVPANLTIQNVVGPDVAGWSLTPDREPTAAGSRLLVVTLKSKLATGADVRIDGFLRRPDAAETMDLPALEPLGVVRETGRVALGCADQFQVRVARAEGLTQINHLGLKLPVGSSEGCTLFSAYRYNSRPWQLQLRVTRTQPHIAVAAHTAVVVAARQVTLRSLLKIHVADAPVPSLRLRLPATLRVSQVRIPPGNDWFIERDDSSQHLKVDLNPPLLGDLELAIRGSYARADQNEFTVPAATLEKVPTQRGQLAIYVDDDLEAVLLSNGGAQSIDPARLDRVLRPAGEQPVQYAFRYESPPRDVRLRLTPAPSRVTGDVITVVSVREGGIAYVGNVDYKIRQAGRARFRIATPAWLGDDVEIRGMHVRQVRSQTKDKQRIWEIELQQPVRGTYRLQLLQTLPLPDDGAVLAAVVRPLDVERSRSHVVLENLTPDEITVTTTHGMTAIPISAVPEPLTKDVRQQAVAAYRVTTDDATMVWQRRVREQESGLTASINLADLTTVIHADGHYQARAAYNIRNFTLQFLELELPADSQVWSVHVSEQPVRPAKLERNGRLLTLLPLEKTSAGDFSSKVVLIYSGYLGAPLTRWSHVTPPAPRIVSDVPVSRTLWTLLLPSEYRVRLLDGESNVEEVEAAYQQQERKLSFLDELRQMVQVASSTGKSGAGFKARHNLKQVGSALQNYASQSMEVETRNAADVQQQAQQLKADIQRLEAAESTAGRAGKDVDAYFQILPGIRDIDRLDTQLDRSFESLSKLPATATAQTEVAGALVKPHAPAAARPQQQRGQLREQAGAQLERLQTLQRAAHGRSRPAKPHAPAVEFAPRGKYVAEELLGGRGLGDDLEGANIRTGAGKGSKPAVGTAALSLDLDLALAGTAYHFRKLHGDPRLTISVRNESLTRLAIALLWAALCLIVAGVAIHGLRRPNAAAFASRAWPWFAALAGTTWLFLLPAGVFGCALLVTSLCVLIARSRRREPEPVEQQVAANTDPQSGIVFMD